MWMSRRGVQTARSSQTQLATSGEVWSTSTSTATGGNTHTRGAASSQRYLVGGSDSSSSTSGATTTAGQTATVTATAYNNALSGAYTASTVDSGTQSNTYNSAYGHSRSVVLGTMLVQNERGCRGRLGSGERHDQRQFDANGQLRPGTLDRFGQLFPALEGIERGLEHRECHLFQRRHAGDDLLGPGVRPRARPTRAMCPRPAATTTKANIRSPTPVPIRVRRTRRTPIRKPPPIPSALWKPRPALARRRRANRTPTAGPPRRNRLPTLRRGPSSQTQSSGNQSSVTTWNSSTATGIDRVGATAVSKLHQSIDPHRHRLRDEHGRGNGTTGSAAVTRCRPRTSPPGPIAPRLRMRRTRRARRGR